MPNFLDRFSEYLKKICNFKIITYFVIPPFSLVKMINISENGYKLTEAIRTIILFIYYWLEGIVLSIIPSRFQKKSVAGEKVLITGAGLQ